MSRRTSSRRETSVALPGTRLWRVCAGIPVFARFSAIVGGLGRCTGDEVLFGRVTLVLFVLCQAFDGLLTYLAVNAMGHGVEGNPILATWMTLAGAGPTLIVAKLAACLCGIILYAHGTHRALAALTAVYLVVAIGPWLYLLGG